MKSAREKILRRRILIAVCCVIAVVVGIVVCVQIKESRPNQYEKNRKQLEQMEQADIRKSSGRIWKEPMKRQRLTRPSGMNMES